MALLLPQDAREDDHPDQFLALEGSQADAAFRRLTKPLPYRFDTQGMVLSNGAAKCERIILKGFET